MLDALARAPLWEHGIDYGHGTGHGVGYFLAVHEGPQNIGKGAPDPHMAMEPGMVTSVEPGIYRPGQWGTRTENLVLAVAADTGSEFGEFLEFETLTLCPIDTRCLDRALLRPDEIDWLNRYHATVRERLAPLLIGAGVRVNPTAPGVIVFLRRGKPKDRIGKITLINASGEFRKGTPKNFMTPEAITKIAEAYHAGKDVAGFVKVITGEEAVANDYNLSPSRFVATANNNATRDLPEIIAELQLLDANASQLNSALAPVFASLTK